MDLYKLRLLVASVFSPIIVPVLLSMTFRVVYGEAADTDEALQSSISTAQWLSYFITLLIGAAIYFWFHKKGWQSWYMYTLAGLALGLLSWLIFSLFSNAYVTILFFVFTLAGLCVGLSFWVILNFHSQGNNTQKSRRRRRRS